MCSVFLLYPRSEFRDSYESDGSPRGVSSPWIAPAGALWPVGHRYIGWRTPEGVVDACRRAYRRRLALKRRTNPATENKMSLAGALSGVSSATELKNRSLPASIDSAEYCDRPLKLDRRGNAAYVLNAYAPKRMTELLVPGRRVPPDLIQALTGYIYVCLRGHGEGSLARMFSGGAGK